MEHKAILERPFCRRWRPSGHTSRRCVVPDAIRQTVPYGCANFSGNTCCAILRSLIMNCNGVFICWTYVLEGTWKYGTATAGKSSEYPPHEYIIIEDNFNINH
jgi:hypothetical protein